MDEKTAGQAGLTDDAVRALVAQIAEAVRRGTEREPSFWDKFWERLPHVSTFVGSVVLGVVALMFNANYNEQQKLDAAARSRSEEQEKKAQAAFEEQKFIAEERERQRRVVIELSQKILSEREPEREGGQALLSHFYPGEAPHILREITRGDSSAQQQAAEYIDEAEETARATGAWGVVVGSDTSLAAAQDEQRKAGALGFVTAVYRKGGASLYTTVAEGRSGQGGFDSTSDAEAARIPLRIRVRDDAFVVGLKHWCQSPEPQAGYVQCAN
jgi:hypothetical protein